MKVAYIVIGVYLENAWSGQTDQSGHLDWHAICLLL